MTWTQHGGSGSGITLTEAMDLPMDRFLWWAERVAETREEEHRALKAEADRARQEAQSRRR